MLKLAANQRRARHCGQTTNKQIALRGLANVRFCFC
jgi:hypothetical protein